MRTCIMCDLSKLPQILFIITKQPTKTIWLFRQLVEMEVVVATEETEVVEKKERKLKIVHFSQELVEMEEMEETVEMEEKAEVWRSLFTLVLLMSYRL